MKAPPKKIGEEGGENKTSDEKEQQNNFLSFLFTLSQSAHKPEPQITFLFTSHITALCDGAQF